MEGVSVLLELTEPANELQSGGLNPGGLARMPLCLTSKLYHVSSVLFGSVLVYTENIPGKTINTE